MDSPREKAILALVRSARKQSDAFIVVGILPGGRFFYDCDDRIPVPDLHGALVNNVDAICASVARVRKERSQS